MSDYSIYPNAIDGYAQLPLVVDTVTKVDAVTVNRLRSAIHNIELELGIIPSGDFESVAERFDSIDSLISDLDAAIISLENSLAADMTSLENSLVADITSIEESIVDLQDQIDAIGAPDLGYKNPVRVATLANITLAGGAPNTLDGITLALNDRILVHVQTDTAQNGIYYVSTLGTGSNGTWTRATDADTAVELMPGTEVYVIQGDTYQKTKFWLITAGPYTLGTTGLEFIGGLTVMQSDSAPTTILAATAIGASYAASTKTSSISVRNFKEIDFSFAVTNLASITDLRMRILYSIKASPGTYAAAPEDWAFLLAEDITSGVSTADTYTISLDTADYPGLDSVPGSVSISSGVYGLHMMIMIWSETGSPVGSDFTGYALRRV